ncbi:MAG: Cell division protein FtsK [uncultured Campylobacterales bacterium]|uniref:Cell division protein FtsK n=1 Tax=uncultured Campylobacterales bacterium TaxID=352960 RepID=A0A6S6TB88_9BACT|nr:MAG: Cell division protein FtsK [uncultured Campylobacterales bacterium]
MREILLVFAIAFFIFVEISTIYIHQNSVGILGYYFGFYSREIFGYMAFVYPIILLYLSYSIYKTEYFDKNFLKKFIIIVLLFVSILMAQSLIFKNQLSGMVGDFLVTNLLSIFGPIGIWIFVLATFSVSFIVLFDIRFEEMFFKIIRETNLSIFKLRKKEKNDFNFDELELQNNSKNNTINTVIEDLEETNDEKLTFNFKNQDEIEINENKKSNSKTTITKELEENKKLLNDITLGNVIKPKGFTLPSTKLLNKVTKQNIQINEAQIDEKVKDLLIKLKQFKIDGDVIKTYFGPIVTTFEFRPAAHVKVSKILNLQDDLAMALKASTIRIQAPIPGKDVVGIEIPNEHFETIYLKELLEDELFSKSTAPLTLVLGKDIVGNLFVTDLAKLPHLLIAGTTGSGKSVGINAMILSLLYKNSPDDLRLLMIDPKMLEFSMYNDIPHLLLPVITDSKKAVIALSNMVLEMERRYKIMSTIKVKNINGYNEKAASQNLEKFPYIVVIIDELADLMMTSGKDVEYSISRLSQMARASGIHLIVATQRPSVDVVTGLIKANLPSRISYKVGQKIDSKVILDSFGAESLIGRGDMLFTPPGSSGLIRLHAPFSTEEEIDKIVNFLKAQRTVEYDENFLKQENSNINSNEIFDDELDELYEDAKQIVINDKKASISYLQRRLQIGYNRAARIVEQLEFNQVLSEPNTKGAREILL